MTKCAQVLQEKVTVDFVDINMGCPIDLVYQQVRRNTFNIKNKLNTLLLYYLFPGRWQWFVATS
jgi:hypothetical protein